MYFYLLIIVGEKKERIKYANIYNKSNILKNTYIIIYILLYIYYYMNIKIAIIRKLTTYDHQTMISNRQLQRKSCT